MLDILHIIVGLNVGGAELMLKRLAVSHLASSSYCHTVISLTRLGKVGDQLQKVGIEVIALDLRSPLSIVRVLWQLVRIIKVKRPDIVQTWMYHADLLGGISARIAGNSNVIWGIRTTEIKSGGSRLTALICQVCALLSRWIPHTIVCAAEASRLAHVAIGYDASKMKVISNGFEVERLVATKEQVNSLKHECGLDADSTVIGSLGRFHKVKDHANFIRAAGLIAPQFPKVRFLLVGRDLVHDNAELTALINATGYPGHFVLLGERTDVPVCLAAMDVLCLHSLTEGFPNVIGEAMSMGVPCVSTDVGDAALLIADTGTVVPKANSEALAQGLTQLLELTREDRTSLGQKAKMRIHTEFTLDQCRERFENLYQQILTEERI
jgi:glycosyltransferase involved in cell wall biosynthesis